MNGAVRRRNYSNVGVPDGALGECIVGFVKLADHARGMQPQAIVAWLATQLADHKLPEMLLLVDHIPVMDYAERNAAKRFISLIDTLYDNAVKLMASAAADPVSLYLATDGNEANEFKRTSSRLIEMSSESYLALPHGHKDSAASGATTGLVET